MFLASVRRRMHGPATNVTDRPLILIADDDSSIRLFMETALRREGFDTVLAANGRETLELLRERAVEVLLLDLHCRSWTASARSVRSGPAICSGRCQ